MSNILSSSTFGERLYKTLPKKYRLDDESVNLALKRYLEALSEGGFAKVIDELNGILDLVDPEKIDADLLPILFESYGLSVFDNMPEAYTRKLLPNIGELYSLKGTTGVVEYLSSLISGVKSEVSEDTESENMSISVRLWLSISEEGTPSREQLLRVVKEFVPFFCDVTIVFVYLFLELEELLLMESNDRYDVSLTLNEPDTNLDNEEINDDVVQEVISESGTFINITLGVTNLSNSVLNDNFYTNSFLDYDIITQGGTVTTIYSI